MSSASPFGASTSTSKAIGTSSAGVPYQKKDIFEIWRAHKPPYIATISPRHPVDLSQKFVRSMQFKGPKLFIALSPCPTGWHYDPSQTEVIAKLAVETGVWALKEAVNGEVNHTYVPSKFKPIEEYLSAQGRFSHLFSPLHQGKTIEKIREQINHYWNYWRTHQSPED